MRRSARTLALLMVAGTVCCSDPPAPSLPPGTRVGYYAAPNGSSSGDGSSSRPWDLRQPAPTTGPAFDVFVVVRVQP